MRGLVADEQYVLRLQAVRTPVVGVFPKGPPPILPPGGAPQLGQLSVLIESMR